MEIPGVQRRKSESDELQMRSLLKEGDLLIVKNSTNYFLAILI